MIGRQNIRSIKNQDVNESPEDGENEPLTDDHEAEDIPNEDAPEEPDTDISIESDLEDISFEGDFQEDWDESEADQEGDSLEDDAQEGDASHGDDWSEDWEEEAWAEDQPARSKLHFIPSALAILAVTGWTGAFAWAHQQEILSGASLEQWVQWVPIWSVPVLLIAGLWHMMMRSPAREAVRFTQVTQSVAGASEELERRLEVINRELSVARDFLAAESLELESVGRVATEHLSSHADRLHGLLKENCEQVDHVSAASNTAIVNLDNLRDNLPVVANSARDVSNQIGTAGRTAQGQVAELNTSLSRLTSLSRSNEKQVGNLQTKVEALLTDFRVQSLEFEKLVEGRFVELQSKSETFQKELISQEEEAIAALQQRAMALEEEFDSGRKKHNAHEAEALAALQERLAALNSKVSEASGAMLESEDVAIARLQDRIEEFKTRSNEALSLIEDSDQKALETARRKMDELRQDAEAVDANIAERQEAMIAQIAERQQAMETEEAVAISALEERFEALDQQIDARRDAQIESASQFAQSSEAIVGRLEGMEGIITALVDSSNSAQETLSTSATALTENLQSARDVVSGTDAAVVELTDASVRLLELIQASSQHSREELPEAIATSEERLRTLYEEASRLSTLIEEADANGESLSNHVLQTSETGQTVNEQIASLRHNIEELAHGDEGGIENIRASLASAKEESEQLSEETRLRLRDSIGELEEAARKAPKLIEDELAERVDALAAKIGERSASLVETQIKSHIETAIDEFEQTSNRLTGTSQAGLTQLHDQLSRVSELTSNLENRVARAREQAEEQVGHDFARRSALITEALNSSAIDISKALDADVPDTSWASYLRGDRGIFTRRAVRLLDNVEARDIAKIYDIDSDFRDNVSRYIADFEAMLRTMLSTRDGNALGVTLLSSDMGKLYVVLAQSVERLRD